MDQQSTIRVLLIEDNATDVLILKRSLREVPRTEFELIQVERLARGIEVLRRQEFDVVLLDLGLPDSSGIETIIKLHQEIPSLPVLVLTGLDDETVGLKAMQEGAQDYLIKGQLDAQLLGRSIRYAIERQKNRRELIESDERLKLALAASRMGVWEWEIQSGKVFWSPECYEILSMPDFDGTLDGFFNLIHPDDIQRIHHLITESIQNHSVFSAEFKIQRKNGEMFWLFNLGQAQYDSNNNPVRMVGIAHDITARKQNEEDLARSFEQLRLLAARLQTIREEERTRIAREIHDELGQALTGLKFDLTWLEKKLSMGDSEVLRVCRDKTTSMTSLLNSTINIGRKIATELRPGILDDLGLVDAIEWQSQEFQNRTGIYCEYTPKVEDLKLNSLQTTSLFRILQETLTNIARHAQATAVSIKLETTAKSLTLTVSDDGRGITEAEINQSTSLGLLGLRERVYPFGGEVIIQGQPGVGTTVVVSLPLTD